MFGSVIRARKRSRKRMSMTFTGAPFVSRVTAPRFVFTTRPSIFSSRSGTLSAIRSITFSLRASRSVTDTDDRTAFSIHSAFRPRSSACARSMAAAISRTVIGVMAPSISITETGRAAQLGVAASMARRSETSMHSRASFLGPVMEASRPRSEGAAKRLDRFAQARNLGGGIVDREAGPQGADDAEPPHEGLRAMMPRPHADPPLIEEGGAVVRVNSLHVEGDHGAPELGIARPVKGDAGNALEGVHGETAQGALVSLHPRHPKLVQVHHRCVEADRLRDGRGARLEAPRQIVPLRVVDPDLLDHLAAAH